MLSTISCQVEEDVVSSKNQSEIKVKKIGKNRINNYSFALEKINKINKAKKENMNSKIIIDTVLDILIDTEEAMLIEGNNFTSLTFPIFRENSTDFENLVVQQIDNTTKTYLVNYGPNKEAAINGQNTNASIIEIAFNTESLNNKIFYSSSNTVVYSDETGNLNYYCDETYEITNEYGYMDVANPSTGESTTTLIDSNCYYYWSFHYTTGGGVGGESTGNHGGLGAGTGSSTVTTAPITTTMEIEIIKTFIKNLSAEQFAWWTNPANSDAVASISSYLSQVDADQTFAIELIDDMINFPNPEGEDNGDEFNYSDYTDIQTTTQTLPSRNLFYSHFPKVGTNGMPSPQVYQLVGGHPYQAHLAGNPNYQNACALRISRALNYSGNTIPIFKNNNNEQKTERGDDNLNYILDASSLLAYMKKTFPNSTPIHLVNKTPTEIKTALNGKWGIYIMIPKNRATFGASGHADFWSNTGCLSGCYFDKAKEVYFWELF